MAYPSQPPTELPPLVEDDWDRANLTVAQINEQFRELYKLLALLEARVTALEA